MAKFRIRAVAENGVTTVKAKMNHPMETGARKNRETGERIPAHYIKEITGEYNGEVVFRADSGVGLSRNPLIVFKFKGGEANETIKMMWLDNRGETGTAEAKIKAK